MKSRDDGDFRTPSGVDGAEYSATQRRSTLAGIMTSRAILPDKRRHRGQHPEDAEAFGGDHIDRLRTAARDLSYLLSRGYAQASSLKLVGDRFQLTARQRTAVLRSSCPDALRDGRRHREWTLDAQPDRPLEIDGYNVLITVESALSGGVLLLGRDGALRDLASLHGTYRRVEETRPALEAIGAVIAGARRSPVRWYFDAPVANSGRLRELVLTIASENDWNWDAETIPDPDRSLIASCGLVASSDSQILDGCSAWTNLARHVVESSVAGPQVVNLSR